VSGESMLDSIYPVGQVCIPSWIVGEDVYS
jgi:hypothetical protein